MADSGRDLVLAPNEYCYIISETTGNVTVFTGPNKTALAQQDQPAVFNATTKKFERCGLAQAVQLFTTAPEGWYVSLKNPAQDNEIPKAGAANNMAKLHVGHKVNIPGPVSVALWPGQIASAVKGHFLHSDEYLLVRVYNEKAAKENWDKKILKYRVQNSAQAEVRENIIKNELTEGSVFIIAGDLFTFFVPPTGIDVIKSPAGYTRFAVTLERLEYCILLDENGEKRFVTGPAVVFPEPTEEFLQQSAGQSKFRAFELTEHTGLYLKVVAPYQENGVDHKPGEELFITGADNPIYFPRQEHALIKYGNQSLHHAIVISEGEARYVLSKETGAVKLICGPRMYLPDPRKEVIVRRVLPQETINLLYPGNTEAAVVNKALEERFSNQSLKLDKAPTPKLTRRQALFDERKTGSRAMREVGDLPSAAAATRDVTSGTVSATAAYATAVGGVALGQAVYSVNAANALNAHGANLSDISYSEISDFAGEGFERDNVTGDAPAITLANKYNGAVTVSVWPGYAIQTIRKTGDCRTLVGPRTVMLEYDEDIRTLQLSTGIPKDHVKTKKLAFLRVKNNRIGDVIEAETIDGVRVKIMVNYWVDFVKDHDNDEEKWFLTENYVQLVCNAMRNQVKEICRNTSAYNFCNNIQDVVIKQVMNNEPSVMLLPEINIALKQIDIVRATIDNPEISKCVDIARVETVKKDFEIELTQARYQTSQELQGITRGMERLSEESANALHSIRLANMEREHKEATVRTDNLRAQREAQMQNLLREEESKKAIQEQELFREHAQQQLRLKGDQEGLALRMQELAQVTAAFEARLKAVDPHLIATLSELSRNHTLVEVCKDMAPMALLGGDSVVDIIKRVVHGTVLEGNVESLALKSREV